MWKITSRDSITGRILISRFQYDTPDSNNFDDRDEFRTTAILDFSHRFSASLLFGVEAKTNIHHLVYIFSERSANNNWNRILQFGTKLSYSPSQIFRWQQSAEVLANYTSYDFEEQQNQIRSYVYRKFTLSDSLTIGNLANLQFNLYHRLEFEENGRLFWQDFAEELSLNRQNHYLTIGIQFPLIGNLILYNGISGYIRKEWRYNQSNTGATIHEKWGDFISFGPQMKLFLLNSPRHSALISVARFRVETPNTRTYFINQLDLNMQWYF